MIELLAVQARPHHLGASFEGFAAEARAAMGEHPGTDLLVFPEMHLFHAPHADIAEANAALDASAGVAGGALDRALAGLARELGVTLVPGTLCERGAGGELFNTARVFGADGAVLASYRKVFPWRPSEPFDPGAHFVVFDMPGKGRVGLTICYDAWFPEVTRQVAWMGAELVLNLVKTTTPDRPQELILARAGAIANQLCLLSLNCAGAVGRGDSLLAGPEGEIIAACEGPAPGIIRASVDLGHVRDVRKNGTCGVNRLWHHFRPGEAKIALPAYNGYIDPASWGSAFGEPNP